MCDGLSITKSYSTRSKVNSSHLNQYHSRNPYTNKEKTQTNLRETIGLTTSHLNFQQNIYLICISSLDGAIQRVVQKSLRDKVVTLSHKAVTAGHQGESRLFQTMGTEFYWLFMTSDLIHTVKHFHIYVNSKGLRLTIVRYRRRHT